MLKNLQVRLIQYKTENFPVYKLELEKAEEPKIKFLTSIGWQRKQGNSIKINKQTNKYFSFIDYMKVFDCVDHNKLENS